MNICIPYASKMLEAPLDWATVLGTIEVAETQALESISTVLQRGLEYPIGCDHPLRHRIHPGQTVVIIVSDSFRKTGVNLLLPSLLEYLCDCGLAEEAISFLVATGSHRGPTHEELDIILGESLHRRFAGRVHTHDPYDDAGLVAVGSTSRGTPVTLNRRVMEADCVIATGTVVLHYFGGYGGGRKSIVPGIAGIETIAANHALNLDPDHDALNPDVAIGRMAGNPVAEDMLEAARLGPAVFLINTVLDRRGNIAGIFSGELEAAHEAACAFSAACYTVPIREQADFVVASAGNAKNFVQSHKSLYNACQAAKPDGRIILATPAGEGYGGSRFAEWLELGSREAVIAALRQNAEINGQTALSTLEKAKRSLFITEMGAALVEAMGGRKAESLGEALAIIRAQFSSEGVEHPTCYIMPSASLTVPVLEAGATCAYPLPVV